MSLMCDGLWGIVSKPETPPEEGTERYAKLITCRDLALVTIALFVHPSLLYFLRDPTDPTAVWDKLSL